MRKVFLFTSQDISQRVTQYFHEREDVDLQVATQVTDRDRLYGYNSAVDFCREKGIPLHLPKKLDQAFLQKVAEFAPDVIINAYFPKIFSPALLRLAKFGAINVHPGDLPHYRGTFPTAWAILNGESEITLTVHVVNEKIDAGDIYAKKKVPILPGETGHELYVRAGHACADFLMEKFDAIVNGDIKPVPQVGYGSYYNALPARYHLDWHQSREMVSRHVRVHAKPYFPAFSYLFNRCMLINKVSPCDIEGSAAAGSGFIAKVFDDGTFAVTCVDGCLRVEEFELFPAVTPEEMRLHLKVNARLE